MANKEAPVNPFEGAPPKEVSLAHAPLVRVISQVRFPPIVSIDKADYIAGFQEAIRNDFPSLSPEQTQGFFIGPQGPIQGEYQNTWRFSSKDSQWRVSLARDFISLETKAYVSRKDFHERLLKILAALEEHVSPKLAFRVGIRYIDRIIGKDLENIEELVRAELLGIGRTTLLQHAKHVVSESVLSLPSNNSFLLARWGWIPESETVDPAAIDPIAEPSWLLDLDAYNQDSQEFSAKALAQASNTLAEQIYRFFRWSVTPEFLRNYGGEK